MDDSFLYPFLNRPKVRVKNTANSDAPTGAVMRITSSSFVNRRVVVNVAQPDSKLHRRYLVNCGGLIKAGSGYGWGTSLYEDGSVLVESSGATPQPDEQWGPFPNSWALRKQYPGFIVTYMPSDIGNQIAIGTQLNPMRAWGFAQTSIHAGSTGTVTLYAGLPGSGDTLLNIPSCKNFGPYIHAVLAVEVVWGSQDPVVRRLDSGILMCQTSGGMSLGGTDVACKVLDFGGSDTGDTIAVVNRYFSTGIGASKRIAVAYSATNSGQYHAINTEHASAP